MLFRRVGNRSNRSHKSYKSCTTYRTYSPRTHFPADVSCERFIEQKSGPHMVQYLAVAEVSPVAAMFWA